MDMATDMAMARNQIRRTNNPYVLVFWTDLISCWHVTSRLGLP